MALRVDLAGKIDSIDRRDDGTVRVAANLTRVGVFLYTKPDGTPWREYRPAEEVFSKASLASYGGRPLTVGHRLDAVNASAWRDVAVGDVRDDAQPNGPYVTATVQVSDAQVVQRVDSKDLVEVSCGYRCDLDVTPGTVNGEAYDAIQRNIRLNHVALLPSGRGRAGPDVRLLLDSTQDMAEERPKISGMADNDFGQAQKDRADALDVAAKAKAEADALKGELAAMKARLDAQDNAAKQAKVDEPAKVAARVALMTTARAYLPELRVDSTESDDAIKRAVIAKINPALKCDEKAEPAYVDGMFRSLVAQATQDGGRSAAEKAIAGAKDEVRVDAGEDVIASAFGRFQDFRTKAWTIGKKEMRKLEKASQRRQAEQNGQIQAGKIVLK